MAFEHKAWENVALPSGKAGRFRSPTWWRVWRSFWVNARLPGAGNWHRFGVSDRDPGPPCAPCLFRGTVKGLQWQARRRLKQLDLHNVSTRHGDGWQGWRRSRPFDAIIVTAAPPEIPLRFSQLDEAAFLFAVGTMSSNFFESARFVDAAAVIIDTVEAVALCAFGWGRLA